MHRILYISTARKVLAPHELDAILGQSRRNNAKLDVTGLLLVGGRRFLQALEGPGAAVQETFERIRNDPRHFGIVKLADSPITERAFGNWSMGFEAGGSPARSATLEQQVESIAAPLKDANLRAYFIGFAKSHSARAA